MTLIEQVYTQARLLAQDMPAENQALLEAVCRAAVASLRSKLRDHLTPEDCLADFVTAAGMYALAALSSVGDVAQVEQFSAGDLTVRKNGADAAANCLRMQAELLMAPYMKLPTAFMGV